jgi:hypothetical protein
MTKIDLEIQTDFVEDFVNIARTALASTPHPAAGDTDNFNVLYQYAAFLLRSPADRPRQVFRSIELDLSSHHAQREELERKIAAGESLKPMP